MSIRVTRNAGLNVLGIALPTLVGILAVPLLLHNMGEARLGIFTLALGLIGFAGLFDLGLGRALTQTVATARGQDMADPFITGIVRQTLPWVGLMGVMWFLIFWIAADELAVTAFRLESPLLEEAIIGIRWLSLSIPVLLLSTSMIGVLEGMQQFATVTAVRIPLGALSYLAPALMSFQSANVGDVIAALVVVRLMGFPVWLYLLARALPLTGSAGLEKFDGSAMWRFTGWLTVSNLVGPLMVHADRFYLATVFSPGVVAHYTVPLDTLARSTGLPLAAVNALFPALAQIGPDRHSVGRLVFGAGLLMTLLWSLPVCIAALFLDVLLALWLGDEFATKVIGISRWLMLGIILNGFAHIPYALLQSAGRADLTGRIHLFELPVYAVLIVSLVYSLGIIGAAIAWTARIWLDVMLLHWVAYNNFIGLRNELLFTIGLTLLSGSLILIINVTR